MAEQTVTSAQPRQSGGGPPQLTDAEMRRLTVVTAQGRRDVVVDRGARVGDLLDRLGLPAGAEALSPDGRRLSRGTVLSAAGVADGAVLVAVEPDRIAPTSFHGPAAFSVAHAAGSRATAPGTMATLISAPTGTAPGTANSRPRGGGLAPLIPGLALAALALLTLTLSVVGTPASPVPGALLVAAALAVAPLHGGATTKLLATAVAAAGAAQLVFAAVPDTPGRVHVALVAAALGAVAASILAPRGTPLRRRVTGTVVLAGLALAAAAVVALALSWPAAVVAVMAVALAAPLARVVPDLVFDVDTATMLDLDRLSTTAWSPRPRRMRAPWRRLRGRDVEAEVRAAGRHQRLVLAGLLGAVVTASAVLVVGPPGPPLASVVLLGSAGAGLTLVARRYHQRVDRWLLRVAGLAAVVAGGVRLAGIVGAGAAVAGTIGLLVTALTLVLLAPRVGRGWTSLRWGRLADIVEGLAVAAALPLGIWAADLVHWIRGLFA